MKPINIKKIADRLWRETKQENQSIQFNFVEAQIRFLDTEAGIEFSYTTSMHIKPYAKPIAEWNKSDWLVFVRDAVEYYEENSAFSVDEICSVSLSMADKRTFRFIL